METPRDSDDKKILHKMEISGTEYNFEIDELKMGCWSFMADWEEDLVQLLVDRKEIEDGKMTDLFCGTGIANG